MSEDEREPESSESAPESQEATYDLAPVDGANDADPSPSSEAASRAEDRRCDSCGAPLPEDGSIVVCPSCGYDVVAGRVVTPKETSGKAVEVEAEDESEEASPLVASTSWRPVLIVAGVLLATIAFAMLAGWPSFFPRGDADESTPMPTPSAMVRASAVLRLVIGTVVLVGCGVGAARVTAWLESRPLGDLRAVMARLVLAVAAAACARLIPIESQVLESIVHGVLGIAAIAVVSMVVLDDRGRLLGTFLVSWMLAFLLVVPVTQLIAWSIPIF